MKLLPAQAQPIRLQLRSLVPIAVGTALYAFGLHYFILPNQFTEGGVTGVTVLLNYAFGWPLSLSTLLLNIPIFLLGWRLLGRRAMVLTIIGTLLLTGWLAVAELLLAAGVLKPLVAANDNILVALYAGVTLGGGLGLVFRFGGTTGGADIIARVLSRTFGWGMGQILFAMDTLIIAAALFYISREKVLYTLVAVFIAARIIDFIQDGAYAAKAFMIITPDGAKLVQRITEELDRGVTLLPATGGYSQQALQLVYCVTSRQEVRKLKQLVRLTSPSAFMVISDVQDVIGEGFRID